MDIIHTLALETMQKNKQALIFAPSRASAEKTAEEISKLTHMNYPEFEETVLKAASTPTKQCKRLSQCIKKGIAFHHAGLLQKQKDLIEDEFKSGKVKIICCTPTLAAGMSLPAFRVIIKSLKRYSGKWGMDWIPVLEYMQMAGRAGRPEYEAFGEAITVAKNDAERDEIYERYVCGEPEEIYSKLAVEPVLRTYVLSLISSGIVRNEKSMKEFFAKTFWAHQFKDMAKLEGIMDKMLSLLEEWKFVSIDGSEGDFVSANDMNKSRTTRATRIGRRVSELYLDPLTAKYIIDCISEFNENKNTYSLLHMVSNTLEMRPLLRVKVKEHDMIQDELVKNYELLLQEEPSAFDLEYGEFCNSIKTTLFFDAWINEKDEDYCMETYGVRPGEIRMKLETADWLLYATEELGKILERKDVVKAVRSLRIRVKNGVKEELLLLLKLKNIGRVRARRMYSNGIKDLGDVKKADVTTLGQILGKNIALDVKKQVGEDIKEVPKRTRKGQLSIQKY
ncbi:hypothetical protein HOL21_04585 [Candidatus Woesearchaeota archaeon]|nr:hypothetical protein [Candidatus Woesearchaeota archaeon]MBT6367962.1 hypothetical protein [Candidatus Woesearchaeota archaeon]MBT7763186.1 hypothetical protein [Candidatus Woesearchaeota archaeon]